MNEPSSMVPGRRWPHYIASLEAPQFRWLLASNGAFFLALQGQVLTRSFLAWDLTGSEMSLAYVNIAFAVPMLIFSIFGGVFTDRRERRALALGSQALVICSEASILCLLLMGSLEFWHILVAGAFGGAVIPFSMPSRTALVFNTVGAQRLSNATALSGGVMNMCRVLGPVIMGLLIDVFDVSAAYIVAVCLHTTAFLFLLGVSPFYPKNVQKRQVMADVTRGFRYVLQKRELFICLLFGMTPMFLAMPFQSLLVVFADEVWQVGERGLGIMMSAAGVGGVLGSIWMAWRGENTRRTRLMVVSTLLFALLLAGFSLTPSFYWALVPLIAANIYASAGQTLNSTATQLLIEDEYRGRVSSIMMMTFGLMPLGVVPMAWMAEHYGVQTALLIASLTLCAAVTAFYALSPKLRNLDTYVIEASKGDQ